MARVHRTKTTAALLATVAVTSLSGCVSVGDGPQPVATPRVSSAPPRAPHADSARPPRLVQPPAREALRLVGPAPRPTAPPYRPPAPAPPTTRSAPAPSLGPPPAPSPSARRRTATPPRPVPPPPSSPPRPVATPTNTDVCALGRAYGGWEPGDRMARLCARAYPGG
ncbi:hypothetical protein OG268_31800 [Streptomyces uncialis]|nr:hypothetical protein OG268_31800 [Streptomyces uncialis]